jgi:hypothetical protein
MAAVGEDRRGDNRPVARIVEVLKIAPGQKIADVGSGDAPFIFPLAG